MLASSIKFGYGPSSLKTNNPRTPQVPSLLLPSNNVSSLLYASRRLSQRCGTTHWREWNDVSLQEPLPLRKRGCRISIRSFRTDSGPEPAQLSSTAAVLRSATTTAAPPGRYRCSAASATPGGLQPVRSTTGGLQPVRSTPGGDGPRAIRWAGGFDSPLPLNVLFPTLVAFAKLPFCESYYSQKLKNNPIAIPYTFDP